MRYLRNLSNTTELATTPKSGENLPAKSEPKKTVLTEIGTKYLPMAGAAVAVSLIPVVGQITLGAVILLSGKVDPKQVKRGYYLLKSITAPIFNKQISVVEHWMDDETKIFVNITMPLYVIIRDSKGNSKLVDYIDSIKNRREVKPSEYSSEEVYNLLLSQSKRDKPQLVIEKYVPTTSEYEELRRAIDRKNKERFIERLPIHAKDREIYSFCYHYEQLMREYVSFNMNKKYGAWVAIRCESSRLEQLNKEKGAVNTPNEKIDWLPDFFKPQLMEDLRGDTQRMLLYAQNIPLSKEQRKELDLIMKIPYAAELYNEAMGVTADGVAVDVLFRADMEESKRVAIVDLITQYLSEPTQTRKAKGEKGFTVQTMAQKSVIALLIKSESLHPAIDTYNAAELHRLTSLFIEEKIGVPNVSYSSKYNEAEIFQDYNPNKLDSETSEYRKYQRFKEFEEEFKRILE